jgi:hypothetical protein
MLSRKAALTALLLLVVVLLGAGAWFWSSQTRLYSNPSAVRTNDIYLRAHAAAEKLPEMPPNFFSSIVVQHTSTNQIDIFAPGSYAPEVEYEPLETHQVSPSQTVQLGAGTIRLAYVATAYAAIRTNIDWSTSLRANYYTPDLRPVPEEEAKTVFHVYDRNLQFYGDFPAASFYFASSNISDFKPFNFTAFDARTHHPLTQGHSSSLRTNLFWFSPTIRLWHQTPIELVVTVATGPAEEFTAEPRPGAELSYPGGVIRVLAVSDVEFGGTSSRGDGRTNHITLKGGPGFTGPGDPRPRSSFLFYAWPNSRLRGEIQFYGPEGKKLQTYGGGTSGGLIHSRVFGRPEDVKEIRFRHYPNVHRLIFTIPELPGLPEENRNLANLFDVHVPSMHFQYEYHFQDNIPQLVQMSYSSLPLTFSNAFFPIIRTNTTARALFQELATMLSNREHQLVADPEENRIEARPNPLYALIQKLRKKVGL